jgi:DnaJ-class molecular chaperone
MARRIDEIDYYTLLGIAADASPDDVQRAFHAFARKYHPDSHRDDPALYARYVAVYRRGTEAYRVLRGTQTRAAYDAGLKEGRLRFDGTPGPGRGSRPDPERISLRPELSDALERSKKDK